jgi:hypothetical protein
MSVRFEQVVLQNMTGITDLSLSIEAPLGTPVYGPKPLPANDSVTVPVFRDNCPSTVLIVDDPDHGNTKQSFAAVAELGLPSYLQSVEAKYYVGEIFGRMIASTEEAPSARSVTPS